MQVHRNDSRGLSAALISCGFARFFMHRIECDFTKLDLICVEFLDSVSERVETFFYFAAIDIETEISLEIESKYVPGSNAFDPKEKVEGKVSKRVLVSYSSDAPKKVDPKSDTHPYSLRVAHSEDLRILDL